MTKQHSHTFSDEGYCHCGQPCPEIERLRTALRQLAHKAGEELGGFHSIVTFAEDALANLPVEPKPNATPGAAITGEPSELWTEGSRLRELQPVGQDFDKDLAHLDNVRATMADMKRYGSLQGIPMHEADFLLSFIDNLWREYSKLNNKALDALVVKVSGDGQP